MEAVWAGDWRADTSDSSSSSVLSVHNLQHHSSVFTRLLLHDKLTSSVQQLMEKCGEVYSQQSSCKKWPHKCPHYSDRGSKCGSAPHQGSPQASKGGSSVSNTSSQGRFMIKPTIVYFRRTFRIITTFPTSTIQ